MKFITLTAKYKDSTRHFNFHENTTLIHSTENSVGKSTLLRMLFYSLGYPVPGTDSIIFRNLQLELEVNISGRKIIIHRRHNQLHLIDNNISSDYILPHEHNLVLEKIFHTKEKRVLSNIIGAIYLDQDKGWTLLNRGKVIGDISFSIETLVEGLTNADIEELKQQLVFKTQQKEKYQGLKAISTYKATHLEVDTEVPRSKEKILIDELTMLGSKKKIVENQLKKVDNSVKENRKTMELLENMKLEVYVQELRRTIPVNKNTITNYDSNYNYLDARKWLLKEKLADIDKDIDKNKTQLLGLTGQNSLFGEEKAITKADSLIGQIEINEEDLDYYIELLKIEIKELKEQIDEILSKNTEVVDKINKYILDYSSTLNVKKHIQNRKNFLFTNKLKGFSGTVLHKLVISYKLAYIKAIQDYLDIQLPIVLDSPGGREMTQENLEDMFDLIQDEFPKNQIIIASIYNTTHFKANKLIKLTKERKIFEGSNLHNQMDIFDV